MKLVTCDSIDTVGEKERECVGKHKCEAFRFMARLKSFRLMLTGASTRIGLTSYVVIVVIGSEL